MPVINIKDAPLGWENDERYVYIGRKGAGHDGRFGNPFRHGPDGTRDEAIGRFSLWLQGRLVTDPDMKEAVKRLHGRTLVCFCKPKACHGDVLERVSKELFENSQNQS